VLALHAEVARAGTLQHGVTISAGEEHERPLALALDLGDERLHHHRALGDHLDEAHLVLALRARRRAPRAVRAPGHGRFHDQLRPPRLAPQLSE
jgi:hypothetical protein